MSDGPSGSGTPTPKAIGSLAKKPSDVTRQGTQKLKFVPTLPQRRKKEDVKAESTTTPAPPPSISNEGGRGRGRGRAEGGSRGRGRGVPVITEMTASGPFAMGPTLGGASSRRSTPRSNFAPVMPPVSSTTTTLSDVGPPTLRRDVEGGKGKAPQIKPEDEVYSDPDDGVEIVDMEHVRHMDWMAPESLQKERQAHKKRIKKEEQIEDLGPEAGLTEAAHVNEEDEEFEDIIESFAAQNTVSDGNMREDRLYLFQFPSPFPTFVPKTVGSMPPNSTGKKVSFAADIKADTTSDPSRTPSITPAEPVKRVPLDGMIGQLEVYRSGAIKIRLSTDILLDVNAATQPSFLQQAIYQDSTQKKLIVLGEVNKQFVVSPNVDALLSALEKEENMPIGDDADTLLKMDTT